MRTFLSENCSRVRPKRSLERGSCEGLGMTPISKRLTVDHDHPHDNPQMKKMKVGSERQAISPLKFPGQLAPTNTKCRSTERLVFHGKEAVNCTEKRPRRKIEMRPPKPIRDVVFIRMGPDSSPQEMQLNIQNKQVSSFEPCKDSRPSQIQREIIFCKQTPGRLDHVSSSRCEVLSGGKYEGDRRPLKEMRCVDNEGMKMGFKVDGAALKVSENVLKNKIGLSITESRNLKPTRFDKFKPATPASEKRMEDPEETGIVSTSQSNTKRPKLRCQFSGGSSYGAVRRTSYDYSGPKSSIHTSSFIVHSPKKFRPSQFQRETVFSKKASGELDPLSSSGCEVFSRGKYDADRRPLVEMICINNEGTKMGFKVDEGAPEVSENDLRNKVSLGIAESGNLKVTRFDKFKPVTLASEERMEDPEALQENS